MPGKMMTQGGMQFSSGRAPISAAHFADAQPDPAKARRRLRIVVADDDRDQVLTLVTLLRDEGHEVRGLHRGKEVVRTVAEFEADVVIVDIKLPDASGFELAEQIRKQHGDARPLLIAISGVYKKEPDRILAEIVGFDHHLTKPFELDALLKLVEPLTRPIPHESLARRTADDTRELVSRATKLVGLEELARQLDVPASLLQMWAKGEAKMPDRKLFLLAAILVKVAERK
jgi:DNA-binding response OmpR family regulator